MITIVRGMAVPEMVTRDGYGAVKARWSPIEHCGRADVREAD
jgi:hypothetical protein